MAGSGCAKGCAGVVVVGVAAVVVMCAFSFCTGIGIREIPDFSGMTYGEATQYIEDEYLRDDLFEFVKEDGSAIEYPASSDAVLSQDVDPGTKVTEVDKCTVTVSAKTDGMVTAVLACKGDSVSKVHQTIIDAGYTPSYLQNDSQRDITDMVVADATGANTEGAVDWVITAVEKPDTEAKTIRMLVSSRELLEEQQAYEQMKQTLETNFPVASAWEYVRMAGEDRYPYGFDLHNILGLISETPVSEDTWRLSATCDVTNAFGAEAKNLTCVCELKLSDGKVQILSFEVG